MDEITADKTTSKQNDSPILRSKDLVNNNNRLLYISGSNDRNSHADLENIYAYIHRNTISSVHGSTTSLTSQKKDEELRVSAVFDPRTSTCSSSIVDASGCVPLKRQRDAAVRRLRRAARLQVLFAVARNAACYVFCACLVISVIEASEPRWHDVRVAVLVVTVVSLLGVGLQCGHVVCELRRCRTSIVPSMLRAATTRADFEMLIEQRQVAAPFVGAELHRGGRLCFSKPSPSSNKHLSQAKRVDMVIPYSRWADESRSIREVTEAHGARGAFWIVVGKDYRYANRRTAEAGGEEVAAFARRQGRKASAVTYRLDVDQGADFPDAAAVLVHYDDVAQRRGALYSVKLYLALSFCCLDSVYCLLFFLLTRDAGSYYIVKYIDKCN